MRKRSTTARIVLRYMLTYGPHTCFEKKNFHMRVDELLVERTLTFYIRKPYLLQQFKTSSICGGFGSSHTSCEKFGVLDVEKSTLR